MRRCGEAQMKLDLNPDWLIKNMNLWRQAADMQIPLRDDLKVHMMARRSDLMLGFTKLADHWNRALDACSAEGDDLVALNDFKAKVDSFTSWNFLCRVPQ